MFFKKVSLLLVVVLVIVISLVLFTGTGNKTKKIFTIDRSYNMAVSILFDNETPDVSFIAPNRKVIEGTSLKYNSGDDWIQFYIPNAMEGTWRIKYDKKSNTQMVINYSSYMHPITISEFTCYDIDNDHIPIHFIANGESTDKFQWEVYATASEDDSFVADKKLAEGSATLGEAVAHDVYVGDLTDYLNYQLCLKVWQKDGIEEVYDSRTTEDVFEGRQ